MVGGAPISMPAIAGICDIAIWPPSGQQFARCWTSQRCPEQDALAAGPRERIEATTMATD
jgi:hypothetical protein